jgi:hypothetical protein
MGRAGPEAIGKAWQRVRLILFIYTILDAGRLVPEIVPADYRVMLDKSVFLVCVLRAFVAMHAGPRFFLFNRP